MSVDSQGTDGGPANDGGADTTHVYAWISRDLKGVEGIIAYPTEYGFMPLIATDEGVARSYEIQAQHAGMARHASVSLVRFSRDSTLVHVKL